MVVYVIKSVYTDKKTSETLVRILFGEPTEEEAVKTCSRLQKESDEKYKNCTFEISYSYEAIMVY